jgi:hypothetical protein
MLSIKETKKLINISVVPLLIDIKKYVHSIASSYNVPLYNGRNRSSLITL